MTDVFRTLTPTASERANVGVTSCTRCVPWSAALTHLPAGQEGLKIMRLS